MLRHPVLVAFDEKRIREQLRRRARDAKIASFVLPFDAKGQVLIIARADFTRVKRNADMVLDFIEKKILPVPHEDARLRLWNAEILQRLAQYYRKEEWRVLFFRWARKTLPVEAFAVPGEDLAKAFFRTALGITSKGKITAVAADLRLRCDPDDSKQRLIEAAFELQTEKDQDELFRDYAPRVVLFAAALFPVGQVPLVIGAAITAITGFLEFMQFLQDAEADGDITEEEAQEAPWALLGILPFRIVQLGLMVRGLGAIGLALLRALIEGLTELPARIEKYAVARQHGWSGYGELESGESLFLPTYAVGK